MLLDKKAENRLKKLNNIVLRHGRDAASAVESFCDSEATLQDVAAMAGVTSRTAMNWVMRVHGYVKQKKTKRDPAREAERVSRRSERSEARRRDVIPRIAARYGEDVADAVRNFLGGTKSLAEIARMAGVTRERTRQWVVDVYGADYRAGLKKRPSVTVKKRLDHMKAKHPALCALLAEGMAPVPMRCGSQMTFEVNGHVVKVCSADIFSPRKGKHKYARIRKPSRVTPDYYVVEVKGAGVFVVPFQVTRGRGQTYYVRQDRFEAYKGAFYLLARQEAVA